MRKSAKIILWISGALVVMLVAAFCLEYFVFQVPVFDRSGWHTTDSGTVQYRDYYATPLTGWQTIGDRRYYFGDDGTMQVGWLVQDSKRYYFDEDGTMHTGWLEENGNRYYMTEQGTPHIGWWEENGERFYFRGPGGAMVTDEWLYQTEGAYLLDAEGHPRTGWVEYEGLRYYLDKRGVRDDRWQDTAEGLTYQANGEKHTGWLDVPEGKFYFDGDGYAQTGWITDETGRFYLYGDGTFATGFVELDGVKRYFTSAGEYIVLTNRWNPVPDDYEMNLVKLDGFQVDAACLDALKQMMADCNAAGYSCKINSAYRSKATQQGLWDTRYETYQAQGYTREQAAAIIGQSVAVPGTSEHQLGLAVDLKGSNAMYQWLAENSWRYGFILRYPDDKIDITGIVYEPWHFRYVGQSFAKEVFESGLCLEEYLQKLEKE